MSIQQQIITNTGDPKGISQTIADIQRQIASLVATSGSLAPGSVTGDRIAAGTIVAAEIQAGTITAAQIAANTITASLIAAGTITAAQIAANTITASNLAAGSVTATAIAANTITGSLIASGTITSTNLASGSVTATQINVSSLAAVSSTMGTVTGGIFQTNTTGARVMMGSSMTTPSGVTAGIVGIDGSNNVTFSIDATTGNVVLKGSIQPGSTGLGNIGGITQNAVIAIAGSNLIDNFSLDTTDLTPFYNSGNYSFARNTTTFLTGPASLAATVTTAGTSYVAAFKTGAVRVPATAGSVYSGAAFFLSNVSRVVTPYIQWFNAGGTLISTSAGAAVTAPAGQWCRLAVEGQTAPANTVSMNLLFGVAGTALNEVHYYDNFVLSAGPSAANGQVVAGSITATEIAAATITSVQIASNTITAGNIQTGAISAGKILAGAIDGMTITGAVVQNTAANPKVALDSAGFWITDGGGTKTVQLNSTAGLQMTVGGGAINKIDWLTGAVNAGSIGVSLPGSGISRIAVVANEPGGNPNYNAALYASSSSGTAASNAVSVLLDYNGAVLGATILDSNNNSGFMKLANTQIGQNVTATCGYASFSAAANNWTTVGWTYTNITYGSQWCVYYSVYPTSASTLTIYSEIATTTTNAVQVNVYSSAFGANGYIYFLILGV